MKNPILYWQKGSTCATAEFIEVAFIKDAVLIRFERFYRTRNSRKPKKWTTFIGSLHKLCIGAQRRSPNLVKLCLPWAYS
jgi:hypothetical protein